MATRLPAAAEHEAAHAVTATALGVAVYWTTARQNGTGRTSCEAASPRLSAIIAAAGDLWDRDFSVHPYIDGSCSDLRTAVDNVGTAGIWQARRIARDILTRHKSDVLALARRIEAVDGQRLVLSTAR